MSEVLTLAEPRTSDYGSKRRHWSILRNGAHIANLGKDCSAWARWSVLPVARTDDATGGYATFSSKAAALAYAATL